jgi:O-antigen/teichoic acid export membrane protein
VPLVIALAAVAAAIAAICTAFIGWDAVRRPRPERVTWTGAFLLFTVAAVCEVIGSATGWSPILARVYYLTGAVLVVGVLALGELYLLLPGRMPSITPGLSLLIVAEP